jgi:WD40 repeat protein
MRVDHGVTGGRLLAVLLAGGFLLGPAAAAEPAAPAADAAVLEIDLPKGATATLDGTDVAAKRRFDFRGLRPGEYREHRLRVRFASGGAPADRAVFLRGGWHVRLAVPEPGATRPEVLPQTGHAGALQDFALSPDGRLLATVDPHACLLWDVSSGRQLRRLTTEDLEEFKFVAFAPDGKHLLTGLWHKAILWEVATGRQVRVLTGITGFIKGIAFAQGGRKALAWANDLLEWDLVTGQAEQRLKGADELVAVSPDGRFGLTGASLNPTRTLWDLATGERVSSFATDTLHNVLRPSLTYCLAPQGTHVTGHSGNKVYVWEGKSGRLVHTLEGHADVIWAAAFSSDGQTLLTSSPAKTVLWEVGTGKEVRAFPMRDEPLRQPRFVTAGGPVFAHDYGASAGAARLVRMDLKTGERKPLSLGRYLTAEGVAFSPDGSRLLTGWEGWEGSSWAVWDFRAGRLLWSAREPGGRLNGLWFLPDGKGVAGTFRAGAKDKRALVRIRQDAETGVRQRDWPVRSMPVSDAVSRDGRRLVTWSDQVVEVWDIAADKRVRTLPTTAPVTRARLSPDGRLVLTSIADQTVQVWETDSGKLRHTLKPILGPIEPLAVSPNGKQALTTALWTSAHLELWDLEAGRSLGRWQVEKGLTLGGPVIFTPDGRLVILGRSDGALVVWDVAAKRARLTLRGHAGWARSLAVSPDNRLLASTAKDGTVRLWDLATGDERACLFGLDDGTDWLAVTPDGLFDGSAGGRDKVSFRVGGGLNVVPVDRFFKDFFRPGLLAALWKGEVLKAAADFGRQRPPTVRIVSPGPGVTVEGDRLTLEVEVTDAGGGVQGPVLFHNGARTPAPGLAERKGRVVRRRFPVVLIPGENLLEVRAASADGSWESEPARLTVRSEKPVAKPDLYVVAVGVNRYAQEALNLKFAAADARALVAVFRARGQRLYRQVEADPYTLVDERATKANIRAALAAIAKKARPQDTVVVFLAGHGTALGQRYYFIPHEFRGRAGVSSEEDVRRQGLSDDELVHDWLCAVPAQKRVLIFDTCHSGAAVGKRGRDPFGLREQVVRLSRSTGVFLITGAAVGEEAQEVDELGHGVLTYALLAGLRAVGRGPLEGEPIRPGNPEGLVDVLEWFSYASGQVPRLTKKYFGREQDVQFSSEGRNFPLLPLAER